MRADNIPDPAESVRVDSLADGAAVRFEAGIAISSPPTTVVPPDEQLAEPARR